MIDTIQSWLALNPALANFANLGGVVLLMVVTYLVARHLIVRVLAYFARRTQSQYDDIILHRIKVRRLALVAPLLIADAFAYLVPGAEQAIQKGVLFVALWLAVLTFNSLLRAVNDIYESREGFRGDSIKGYLDLVSLLVFAVGIILSISLVTGQPATGLLTGLGAVTAVLMLIFRDTILSLVASFQISTNDLVREGDWLEVPAYNADGDVTEMSLHQIKIQNWDKTISIVPTHKMLEVAYKNWRGMSQSGGRRIKRAIHVDLGSIRFVDDAMLEKYQRIELLGDYLADKLAEIREWNEARGVDDSVLVNGRRLTNVGTFRAYCVAYLRTHPLIHQGMTFLIRQLAPGPTGLPIEIYVFTNTTVWTEYEAIQADIFDHLLAVVPEFGLRVFQEPSGSDFESFTRGL